MKQTRYKVLKGAILFLIIMLFAIIIFVSMFISIYFSAKMDENALIVKKAKITMTDMSNAVIPNDDLYRYVPYADISEHVIHAFVALEDKRFFAHNGIDYHRLLGALYNDVRTLSFKEGGSTITQQLAKNTLLSGEKTLKRKIKEMHLARLIEKQYTKEQILEMYLNAIYYGNGVYGIDSAAKNYFGKKPSELTAAEGAMLAGIVKNPSAYSPKNNVDKAISRRDLVLSLMHSQGYLSENEYEEAKETSYTPSLQELYPKTLSPYFNNALKEASDILQISEKDLILSDIVIHTYYDPTTQSEIAAAILSPEYQATNSFGHNASKIALVADNTSGGINALYSDFDVDLSSFRRQPGSTIKPILVYAPALEYGNITTETPVLDERIDINGYSPKNFSGKYSGWISARKALSSSVNTVAVKLFQEVGTEKCFDFATKNGLLFSNQDGLSAALGGLTDGLTVSELTRSYMTLASCGKYKDVVFIQKITDKSGNILYQHDTRGVQTIERDTAYLTTNMLESVVQDGTASKMRGFPYAIAAKTGTTQSVKGSGNLDAWNVSYSTEKTVSVWYGDLSNSAETVIETTGSAQPTLLARKIYSILPEPREKEFIPPDNVFTMEYDGFAFDNDHALYATNTFTPSEFRKKSVFSLKNCPTERSPYFDLNEISFVLTSNGTENLLTITSPINDLYDYVFESYDLLTGEKSSQIVYAGIDNVIPIHNIFGLYSNTLRVYYHNKCIGEVRETKDFIYENSGSLPRVQWHRL